jgi:hypothetical protein
MSQSSLPVKWSLVETRYSSFPDVGWLSTLFGAQTARPASVAARITAWLREALSLGEHLYVRALKPIRALVHLTDHWIASTPPVKFAFLAENSARFLMTLAYRAYVRFTPESGQRADMPGCPLCAKSGLMLCGHTRNGRKCHDAFAMQGAHSLNRTLRFR